MKRSLILLGLSILTLLGVMVGQVYAGSRIDALFVFPNPAYIHDGNHVDFDWYPEEGVADRVSVRHRSSYEGSSNNLPGVEPNEWHESWWEYDPWDVPDSDTMYWYAETGWARVNVVVRLSTIVAPAAIETPEPGTKAGLFAIGRRSPSGCPAAGPRKKCIWGLRHRM